MKNIGAFGGLEFVGAEGRTVSKPRFDVI